MISPASPPPLVLPPLCHLSHNKPTPLHDATNIIVLKHVKFPRDPLFQLLYHPLTPQGCCLYFNFLSRGEWIRRPAANRLRPVSPPPISTINYVATWTCYMYPSTPEGHPPGTANRYMKNMCICIPNSGVFIGHRLLFSTYINKTNFRINVNGITPYIYPAVTSLLLARIALHPVMISEGLSQGRSSPSRGRLSPLVPDCEQLNMTNTCTFNSSSTIATDIPDSTQCTSGCCLTHSTAPPCCL